MNLGRNSSDCDFPIIKSFSETLVSSLLDYTWKDIIKNVFFEIELLATLMINLDPNGQPGSKILR
ncbi:MAG: hypothetical protein ACTSRA_19750 [Promethearchaeota archaeon]